MQKALEGFVAKSQFELSLDDDRQVIPLRQQDLHTLEPDSTVVMSVVVFGDITVRGVKCPLCKAFIPLAEKKARILWYVSPLLVLLSASDFHMLAGHAIKMSKSAKRSGRVAIES
ncbi:hypothetical protein FA13DRAFT_1725591 [Coprinellus micaceus]|uniref:Uncharacterized protein n=1 Tax=Coprinellus micaceus TaxID=71717 RepID=A0A4Y7TUW2_COPMI|nr:hypothetical protein FA13DRAFT_1725591 [Coprinellus micaceus]